MRSDYLIRLGDATGSAQTYTLTGAKAYRYDEVASKLAAATGRPITYQPGTLLAHGKEMIAAGADSTYANVQLVHTRRFGRDRTKSD